MDSELIIGIIAISLTIISMISAFIVYIIKHERKHQEIDDKLQDVAPNSELQYIKETVSKVETSVNMILDHLLNK